MRKEAMDCRRFGEDLWLYLYDELAAERRSVLEGHLQACASCRRQWEEARALGALLNERTVPEPSVDLLAEARLALDQALDREEMGWRGWWRSVSESVPLFYLSRGATIAALMVFGFGLGWLVGPRAPETVGPEPSPLTAPLTAGNAPAPLQINDVYNLSPDPQTGQVQLTVDAQQQVTLSGTADNPQIQDALLYALQSYENPGIRRESIGLLRPQASDERVRQAVFRAMLEDSNDGVRVEAFDTIRNLVWSPEIRHVVVRVLEQDSNEGLRVGAANLLIRHAGSDAEVVPVLRRLASSDRNRYVRLQCARALHQLQTEAF